MAQRATVKRGNRVVTEAGAGLGAVIGTQPDYFIVAHEWFMPVILYVPTAAVRATAPGAVIIAAPADPARAWGVPPVLSRAEAASPRPSSRVMPERSAASTSTSVVQPGAAIVAAGPGAFTVSESVPEFGDQASFAPIDPAVPSPTIAAAPADPVAELTDSAAQSPAAETTTAPPTGRSVTVEG